MDLPPDSLVLFKEVTGNTIQAYQRLYQTDELPPLPEGNIGDIGFFLIALKKCSAVFPELLPIHWKETMIRLIKTMLKRQNPDGSIRVYFDSSLKAYEKSSEAFYLPEALIGLIATFGSSTNELDDQVTIPVQKAIAYCCQDKSRMQNLASDSATFYANWQFQLLYHWIQKKSDRCLNSSEIAHLEGIIEALKVSGISQEPFGKNVATVEVACYFEGIIHAQQTLKMLAISRHSDWLKNEVRRSLLFLSEVQTAHMDAIRGGFVHSMLSHEARLDVAGHVFGGIKLMHLHETTAMASEEKCLKLGLCGDVMIGRLVDEHGDRIWGDLLPLLRNTDLTLANLEAALTHSETIVSKVFNFKSVPKHVAWLKEVFSGSV